MREKLVYIICGLANGCSPALYGKGAARVNGRPILPYGEGAHWKFKTHPFLGRDTWDVYVQSMESEESIFPIPLQKNDLSKHFCMADEDLLFYVGWRTVLQLISIYLLLEFKVIN